MDRQITITAAAFVPGVAVGLAMGTGTAFPVAAACLMGGYVLSSARSTARTAVRAMVAAGLMAMLFGAGMLCAARWASADWSIHNAMAQRQCEALQEAIDSLPFRSARTPSLLKAFLTGDRTGLDKETVRIFRDSGASHLLALSGLHLGIIYMILSRLLFPAGGNPTARKVGSTAIVLIAGTFTIMTGATPSLVRAFLFIAVRETAAMLSRKVTLGQCLCTALILQLAMSPGSLSRPGFQLSYLAMMGICTMMEPMQRLFPGKGPMKKIWDMACMSISCQAFTAPLAWKLFRSFPQYFLITNLLAMPLMTVLMACAVPTVMMAAAGIGVPVAAVNVIEWSCDVLMWVLQTVASLPLSPAA